MRAWARRHRSTLLFEGAPTAGGRARPARRAVYVPELGVRVEDVPLPVRHFLETGGFRALPVTPGAMRVLQERPWPGNVRELKHAVEWCATLAVEAISEGVIERCFADRNAGAASGSTPVRERLTLCDVLERHEWDTERAALELGIHRATLYRRTKRLQLASPATASIAAPRNGSHENVRRDRQSTLKRSRSFARTSPPGAQMQHTAARPSCYRAER